MQDMPPGAGQREPLRRRARERRRRRLARPDGRRPSGAVPRGQRRVLDDVPRAAGRGEARSRVERRGAARVRRLPRRSAPAPPRRRVHVVPPRGGRDGRAPNRAATARERARRSRRWVRRVRRMSWPRRRPVAGLGCPRDTSRARRSSSRRLSGVPRRPHDVRAGHRTPARRPCRRALLGARRRARRAAVVRLGDVQPGLLPWRGAHRSRRPGARVARRVGRGEGVRRRLSRRAVRSSAHRGHELLEMPPARTSTPGPAGRRSRCRRVTWTAWSTSNAIARAAAIRRSRTATSGRNSSTRRPPRARDRRARPRAGSWRRRRHRRS